EVDVIDFKGGAAEVAQKVKQAGQLLSHGKLQAGRMVVDELASEMDITTVNIPLGTYPAAIKNAAARINAGKAGEAEQILDDALNSLVEQTEIIPLPLLRAEALVLKASELEQKSDLSKEKNRDEILGLVAAAKEKLKIAQLLGYGDKADYQPFYKVIDDIKGAIHTEKSAAVWAKVKQALEDLKNKIMPAKK
ncbi:MAG: YfdX family protein, partial [Methylomonas sp.]